MICIIRIRGQVGLEKKMKETLNRLGLRKKYSCIVLKPTKENLEMLKKLKNFVAYGEINEEDYELLKTRRGKENKKYFRLHPPRGGIKSKVHHPKGVLGDHGSEINKLMKRML